VSNIYCTSDVTLLKHCTQAAYEINKVKEFEPQPPVYAVLTDLKDFYFFSYDGSTFKIDKEIWVSSATRAHFFHGMAEG
jgi:hypothetical protein